MTPQALPIPNHPHDQLNYGVTPPWDSDPPDLITSPDVEPRAYPMPTTLRPYVRAVQELAGCSAGMAAMTTVGAINLSLANDWDVRSLAPKTRPITLFLVPAVESGGRKSTAHDLAWTAHVEADREIVGLWESIQDRDSSQKEDDQPTNLLPQGRRRKVSPKAIRSNTTIEALFRSVDGGRHCQSLASSECGTLTGGWSLTKANKVHTFACFNQLWDGSDPPFDRVQDKVELYIKDKRLSATLSGQRSVINSLILDPASANGFSARVLLFCDPLTPPSPRRFRLA